MEEYGEVKHRGSRSCSHHHNRNRSRGGMGGSSEDYQTLGTDSETVYGGVSSRTESSNQLDDIPSIRDHSIYGRGPGNKDLRDAVYSRDTSKEPREVVYSMETQKEASEPVYGRDLQKDTIEAVFTSEGSRESTSGAEYQHKIHHNLLYHAESSTSPEPSPTTERKSFPRRVRARSRVIVEERDGGDHPEKGPVAEGSPSPHTSHHPPPSYPGDDPPQGSLNKSPGGTTSDSIVKLPNTNAINTSTKSAGGTTTKEPSEVNETESDRAIVPPPRRYSDAKAKARVFDYSIAV